VSSVCGECGHGGGRRWVNGRICVAGGEDFQVEKDRKIGSLAARAAASTRKTACRESSCADVGVRSALR